MDQTALFYSQPTYARGGSMSIFASSRRQRSGNVMGAIKNFFISLLSAFGIRGARAAVNLAQNVVGDVSSSKQVGASPKGQGIKAAKRLGNEMISDILDLVGTNLDSRRRTATKRRSAPSHKRPASSKTKPSAKRGKTNF